MAATQINTGQIFDGGVQRTDLCTTIAGKAVIAKAVQGASIKLTSGGADAGTGDVTIAFDPTVNAAFTAAQTIIVSDAETGGASTAELTVSHNTSGLPGTNLGATIEWQAETTTANNVQAGRISCQWSTATGGSQAAYFDFLLANGGGATSKMRLWPQGDLSVGSTTNPNQLGGGIVNANTGFRVANAAASNTHLGGNGQSYVSTTNKGIFNASTATQTITTTDTYLTGSLITIAAGDITAGSMYHAVVYVSKGAVGTASLTINLRAGTGGSTSDLSISGGIAPSAQTAVADTGLFEIFCTFASPGASCQPNFVLYLKHNTANGLWAVGASGVLVGTFTQPATFNSTGVTKIGLSFNGGNATNYTVFVLKAELLRP